MKKLLLAIFLIMVFFVIAAVIIWQILPIKEPEMEEAKPVVDVTSDIEANKNLIEELDAAYNAGDIDRYMSFYTDDVVSIPPNAPPLIGKEAVRSIMQQIFDLYALEYDLVVEDVKIGGDLAFVRGAWTDIQTPKAGGESFNSNGSFVAINQKQPDGSWKTICDIWTWEQPISSLQEKE